MDLVDKKKTVKYFLTRPLLAVMKGLNHMQVLDTNYYQLLSFAAQELDDDDVAKRDKARADAKALKEMQEKAKGIFSCNF